MLSPLLSPPHVALSVRGAGAAAVRAAREEMMAAAVKNCIVNEFLLIVVSRTDGVG